MSKKPKNFSKFSLFLMSILVNAGLLGINSGVLANGSDYTIKDGGTVFWGVRTAGGGAIITDEIGFEYGVSTDETRLLYEDFIFNEQDEGATFTATSTNDSDFDFIVEQLTDGMIDDVFLNVTFANGDKIESSTLDTLGDSDFQGLEITSIDLVINALEITTPGNDPNGDGNWTQVTYDVESVINIATVPEPTSVVGVVGFASLASLALFKRTHK